MMSVGVEYPALPSTVECVGVVGFILRLKAQVFSLILYKYCADTHGLHSFDDRELIPLVVCIHRNYGVFDPQSRQRLTFNALEIRSAVARAAVSTIQMIFVALTENRGESLALQRGEDVNLAADTNRAMGESAQVHRQPQRLSRHYSGPQ